MNALQVKILTSRDAEFAALMEPLLTDQAFRGRVRNEADTRLTVLPPDAQTWFVAVSDGMVAGFCVSLKADFANMRFRPDVEKPVIVGELTVWQSNYVLPAHRGCGVFAELARVRNEHSGKSPVITYVFDPLVGLHLQLGFRPFGDGTSTTPDGVEHHWTGLARP